MEKYLSGEALYGDDMTEEEILAWYDDEKEGYADLGAKDWEKYVYSYHALNELHGFRRLPDREFDNVLGIGSAYGIEFRPIANRVRKITIVDSSSAFSCDRIENVPVERIDANASGDIALEDGSVDLSLCFGVLHPIPNVSHVLKELFRCLSPGGIALIREPIISMGDWRNARAGLTKRERGIPFGVFQTIISSCGFVVISRKFCMFPATPRLWGVVGVRPYNNQWATKLDGFMSSLFSWNRVYHRTAPIQKIGPTCVFWVLKKP